MTISLHTPLSLHALSTPQCQRVIAGLIVTIGSTFAAVYSVVVGHKGIALVSSLFSISAGIATSWSIKDDILNICLGMRKQVSRQVSAERGECAPEIPQLPYHRSSIHELKPNDVLRTRNSQSKDSTPTADATTELHSA
ncbi:hypothetical protein JAAARDRAFT_73617, partial [Jaapia argillacea MUCL 33604]